MALTRDQLVIQERMDAHLDSMSEELHQLHPQLQEDRVKMATMSLQLQEVMSSVEAMSEVVGRDLEEINGCFYYHRGETTRSRRGRRGQGVSLLVQLTRQSSLRLTWTGWRTESADVDIPLLK